MIASSAAWSTSETKSFWRLRRTVSLSRSEEAREMMLPALRAALTAVLSMGCMAEFYYGPPRRPFAHPHRPLETEPSGQYRRGGARPEEDGDWRSGAGGAAPFSPSPRPPHGGGRRRRSSPRRRG